MGRVDTKDFRKDLLSQMRWKNKCIDIFRNAVLYDKEGNPFKMYEVKSHKKFLEVKMQKAQISLNVRKIQIILGLKCAEGMLFIKVLLKKISLIKDLLVTEIEQGNEVYIPKDLSQSQLPLSFRYYDPILKICSERMSAERK